MIIRTESRGLVGEKLGGAAVVEIYFATQRMLCIACGLPNQDEVAAASSRQRIELLRCHRRHGDS